ncbi:hypothetical protein DQQ10_18065 [Pseudochryseolinea flava]|uniref:Uncharacterized protein n=1 Tax=Pseudochryseolinea flava TaxID=2059302 RepID=A0A364XYH7_9BACT|nr:hypothetical protein DQQ10_18065 [Pseudochryseolinea flava]
MTYIFHPGRPNLHGRKIAMRSVKGLPVKKKHRENMFIAGPSFDLPRGIRRYTKKCVAFDGKAIQK